MEKLLEDQEKYKNLIERIESDRSELAKLEKKIKWRRDQNKNGGWKKGLDF